MINKPIISILLLIIFSCTVCWAQKVPKVIANLFTNCYCTQTLSLNKDLQGVYEYNQVISYSDSVRKKNVYFGLYDDGTLLFNILYNDNHAEDKQQYDPIKVQQAQWGIYYIVGDSLIIAQSIYMPPIKKWQRFQWSFREMHFKIVNTSELLIVYEKWVAGDKREKDNDIQKKATVTAFRKDSFVLPPANSWIKNEAWSKCSSK